MGKEKSSHGDVRRRHWAFIVYPESAPADWVDRIKASGLPFAVSPLHNRDINPASEEDKKEHWHVIACYSGPTSFSVVRVLTDSVNAPIPKGLDSVRGAYRYFTHKDHPDKYQYDEAEIRTHNGFNISDYVELTKSEVLEITKQVRRIIREHDMTEYSELLDFLQDNEMSKEDEIASTRTMLFDAYIRSRRHRRVRALLVDPATGEVLEKC